MSDLTEACEKAIAREKVARETLLSKKTPLNEQIQALDAECGKIINLQNHILIKAVPVSKDIIDKAIQDKKKGMSRAEARGETYTMSPYLRDIFAKIEAQEHAIAENKRLSELNREISDNNHRNIFSRAIIENKKKPILRQLSKLDKYIAECDDTIREYEKKLRYAIYAGKHNLDVDLDNIIRLCNQHRNQDICRQLYVQCYKGYSKCCKNYNECDEIMRMTSYHHAECECGYSYWNMLENPSADFDITSNSAEGEDENLSYFGNPSLPRT